MFLQKLLLLLLLALSMLFPRLLLRELPHHPELVVVVVVVKGRGRERSARPGAEDIAFLPKTERETDKVFFEAKVFFFFFAQTALLFCI
jgi:hypothetical protein